MEKSEKIIEKIENGSVKVPGAKKPKPKPKKVESVIQQEGAAHQADDAELHKATDKIGRKVHKQAKATKAKPEAPVFPAETSINAYEFLRIPAKVMEALGIKSTTRSDGKVIHAITKATIVSYDAQTRVLTVKLGA